jgi:hypothetical protein
MSGCCRKDVHISNCCSYCFKGLWTRKVKNRLDPAGMEEGRASEYMVDPFVLFSGAKQIEVAIVYFDTLECVCRFGDGFKGNNTTTYLK